MGCVAVPRRALPEPEARRDGRIAICLASHVAVLLLMISDIAFVFLK